MGQPGPFLDAQFRQLRQNQQTSAHTTSSDRGSYRKLSFQKSGQRTPQSELLLITAVTIPQVRHTNDQGEGDFHNVEYHQPSHTIYLRVQPFVQHAHPHGVDYVPNTRYNVQGQRLEVAVASIVR